ncbi:ARM repeat-containing protein [Mycena floridula]|nr:ARM repeat-containing protein [Mycena floridula]
MASSTQLAECLAATLSSENNTRITAELKLAEYFTVPETGLGLAQLTISQETDLALRQMSLLLFSVLERERWSPFFSTFRGSAPPVELKAHIRQVVLGGLSDPNRKIRSLSARTLSSIANCDWPDEWPELLSTLITLISSNSPDSVHGSMQVFTEFIKSDLTEDQTLPVLRDLLPVLLSILGARDVQSPLTRSRTISVFRQCVISLYMVKDLHSQSVKEATATVLPIWLEAFKVLLSYDVQEDVGRTDNWDALAVRIQVFKALDTINTSFPRVLAPYLGDLLRLSLTNLNSVYPTFERYYLASSDPVPPSTEDEPIELTHLISAILDFLAAVARGGKAKDWFTSESLVPLISSVFSFTQMTDNDEDTWASNANAFVANEDDETAAYSVRVAAFDLLGAIIDRAPAKTTAVFQQTIQQVIHSSGEARSAGSETWWRPLEAALAAIGSQSESIQDCLEDEQASDRPNPIDIEVLLAGVIPSALGLSEFPFLQGRAFVFASQFAKLLPLQLAGQYLEAAIHVLEAADGTIPVKVSAVKAINNFCQGAQDSALAPFMPRIAKDLGPFLAVTSEDTLAMVLEALSVVLEVERGSWMTIELAQALVSAVLDVWSKNSRDPIFLSIFPDILASLTGSSQPGVYEAVVKAALPPLCNAIASATLEDSWVSSSAIDLVASLVKGAPQTGLGEGFFAMLAPSLFKCLGEARDRDVLQNGILCLTLIVRKDAPQILAWSDTSGRTGLDYVLQVVAKLLQSEDESGGLSIGDLIIHLLRRAGDSILPVLPELLHAMAKRMLTAKTATFLQSLVIPFAFLINSQRDTVLSLLETMNVDGRSGLDILIQTWCENAETFQGFWPSRTSSMALSQLFMSERPSLQSLVVKGDMLVNTETKNVIMTRSRTKTAPHEFTSVLFPVKAVKILLHDLRIGGETSTMPPADTMSDDGDEDWSDQDTAAPSKDKEFEYLSELIGPKGMAFDQDDILDDSDDEDLKEDEVSRIDMQSHLVLFFQECAARNTNNFSAIVDQLSAEETLVMQKILESKQ